MTTEQLRPRGSRKNATRLKSKRFRRILAGTLAATSAVAAVAAMHFAQAGTVADMEEAAVISTVPDTSTSNIFREDPVFMSHEWRSLMVMIEMTTASDRLDQAADIASRRDSVWLPWLAGDAEAAARSFLEFDRAALADAEFARVHDQTLLACAAPASGTATALFIDSWNTVSAPAVPLRISHAITPEYADSVTSAAYRTAMRAGAAHLCPEA